ncbi:MAG: hypothetical protein AB7P99_11305, partial [Vicinamibacterales bacterium]
NSEFRIQNSPPPSPKPLPPSPAQDRDARKRDEAERRKKQRARDALQKRIADLEARITEREAQVRELEAAMAAPDFYADAAAANAAISRHQALMWEVGDLMGQWEGLQEHAGRGSLES